MPLIEDMSNYSFSIERQINPLRWIDLLSASLTQTRATSRDFVVVRTMLAERKTSDAEEMFGTYPTPTSRTADSSTLVHFPRLFLHGVWLQPHHPMAGWW